MRASRIVSKGELDVDDVAEMEWHLEQTAQADKVSLETGQKPGSGPSAEFGLM